MKLPHVWIVLFRCRLDEKFEVWCGERGGLAMTACATRTEAKHEAMRAAYIHGERNVRIKKYSAEG